MYHMRLVAIRWQKHDFLFYSNSNICSISYHLRDIRNANKMSKVDFDLDNEGRGPGEKTRHRPFNLKRSAALS